MASSDIPRSRPLWWTITRRALALLVAGVAIHATSPRLVAVLSSAGTLGSLAPAWFVVMIGLETLSFAAAWGLARLAVRDLGWSVAAMAQLASNSASRVLPGGAVMASALYYRMLTRAGTDPGSAAAALTVNSLISTTVLVSLPATGALVAALFSVPLPAGLTPVAVSAVVLFVALVAVGLVAALFDTPIRWVVRIIGTVGSWIASLRHRTFTVSGDRVIARRDEVLRLLGPRWRHAVFYAASNWLLDYAVLVVALQAVGANPRLSVLLLAYSGAAVLAMVPITPGGLGFVEAGLTAALTAAGVPLDSALLATLAYRLVAFWLPIPVGAVAFLVFRRHHPVSIPDG